MSTAESRAKDRTIKRLRAELDALQKRHVDTLTEAHVLREHIACLKECADRFPEINPSNYNDDDVCTLNNWGVEMCQIVDAPAAPEKTV